MKRDNRAGLTLVELLMVIAVIGILAALLLAVIAQARGRAQRIQCASNVRQLGLALQEFRNEHNAYPQVFYAPDVPDWWPGGAWMLSLQNEMGMKRIDEWSHKGVWHCPSYYVPSSYPDVRHFGGMGWWSDDYGYNSAGFCAKAQTNWLGLGAFHDRPATGEPANLPVKESGVASPSAMMAIGDGLWGTRKVIVDGMRSLRRRDDGADLMYSIGALAYDYSASTRRAHARHQDKANVVFCDGHLESPILKFLFEDTSDEALSRWNRDHQPHRERLLP